MSASPIIYAKLSRMGIETVFRDGQSQGCDLEASGVIDPDRFGRLLIVLSLA